MFASKAYFIIGTQGAGQKYWTYYNPNGRTVSKDAMHAKKFRSKTLAMRAKLELDKRDNPNMIRKVLRVVPRAGGIDVYIPESYSTPGPR